MKSKAKSKTIILLTIGILFTISPMITASFSINAGYSNKSLECSDEINLNTKNLKLSAVSEKIHIDNNWTAAKSAGICTGEGTYSAPYIIEDLVIDGGGWGSCIWIENSNVYFRIENCTVSNSESYYQNAGIRLSQVNNSQLMNNNCSSNSRGIYLYNSDNNTISGNTVNNNNYGGIRLMYSDNNTLSGNNASNNRYDGIHLYNSNNNTLSGNIMNHCGLGIYGSLEEISSHDIDTTNLVNGKPLYYYTNEVHLGPDNFTNAGQVILVNCNDSLVSNLNVSDGSTGISLHYCNNNNISGNNASYNDASGIRLEGCINNTLSGNNASNNNNGIFLWNSDNNTISGNTASHNSYAGIRLYESNNNKLSGNTANNNPIGIFLIWSDYNTISGNTLIGNGECISEENCQGNTFSDNGDCTYGQGIPIDLIVIISVISGGAVIGVATLLLIRRKRKRIE